jgi:hypothetical protein
MIKSWTLTGGVPPTGLFNMADVTPVVDKKEVRLHSL